MQKSITLLEALSYCYKTSMAKTSLQEKQLSSISAEHVGATACRGMRNAQDIPLPETVFDKSNTEILNHKSYWEKHLAC